MDTVAPVAACDGDTVRAIVIRAERPPFTGHMRFWRSIARRLGLHHATTRESVVRRFVTLGVGQPCSEFRRAESERLLRAQPYLASSSVRALAEPGGGVRIEVRTVDEVPALFEPRLRRGQLAALMVGNENIFGLGVHTEVRLERGFAYRDGFGGTIIDHQFLGRPYALELDGQRDPIGGQWGVGLGHPYLTDLQRIAWHTGFLSSRRFRALTRGDSHLALAVRREAWDVGGVARFGPPGLLWFAGGVLTHEWTRPAGTPVLVTREGMSDPSGVTTALPYAPLRATRANLVTGVRALDFVQARGLDALTATQDIARGIQVGLVTGRGLASLGDADLFVAWDAFAAAGRPRSYVGVQIDGEARLADSTRAWDGVLGSGRLAWYLKPSGAWTTIASVEAAGGWNVRVPFHVALDERQGGMRINAEDQLIGGRRLVGRLEQRWTAGAIQQRADAGLAAFVEVGRLWKGDAPFGMNVPRQVAVGVSILGAFPAGAKRLLRVDAAVPVSGPAHGVELRFSAYDWTRVFWREPDQVSRARAGTLLARIFASP